MKKSIGLGDSPPFIAFARSAPNFSMKQASMAGVIVVGNLAGSMPIFSKVASWIGVRNGCLSITVWLSVFINSLVLVEVVEIKNGLRIR